MGFVACCAKNNSLLFFLVALSTFGRFSDQKVSNMVNKYLYIAFTLILAGARISTAEDLVLDKNGIANTFDGIGMLSEYVMFQELFVGIYPPLLPPSRLLLLAGGLSGGGATSRLLVDYPEKQRSQVVRSLFRYCALYFIHDLIWIFLTLDSRPPF